MKKLQQKELKKLQQIELEMLKEFKKICKKNNLTYELTGGTLLGAIRHNGFIPWDDDIDIAMPRKDYDKFINIQKKELNHQKYYFQSMETDEQYIGCGGKIRRKNSIYRESLLALEKEKQGIWIDIFPIDNVGNNKLSATITLIRAFYYKMLIAFKGKAKPKAKGIKKIILNIIKFNSNFYTFEKLKKKYYKLIKNSNKKETNYVINHGGIYLLKEIVSRKFYENITTHKFEDDEFPIPKDYDEFLTHIYGDYMKLPPKEKRNSAHAIEEIKFPNNNE